MGVEKMPPMFLLSHFALGGKRMFMSRVVVLLCCGFFFLAGGAFAAPQQAEKMPAKKEVAKKEKRALDYIAIVNGQKVSMPQYISALRRGIRDRFYHGKVEEEEARKFRKEVAEELVERALLVQEAKRRNLKPDADKVEASVQAFDAKFKDDPEWAKARDKVLPELRDKLNDDSLAKVIKRDVLSVKVPKQAELKKYYAEHNDLFTTPARNRVSLILLRVDPSSSSEVWKQASDEASSIVERINAGSDFAELARIHSSDKSAANGGDMGFVHLGMLGENAEKILSIMEPGEVSAPVVLLEGVSIFRLEERTTPTLNAFDSVKERAQKLYQREKAEAAWKALLASLHSRAKVIINDAPWR
jgi:peptidylprolyl isomerase